MMKKVLIINEDDEEAKQLQELFINEINCTFEEAKECT